ncbi:MAG: pyridoxamine 5'-phosphate oxidase family protein, partial [Cyclobacteriaceae bacterium]
LSQGIDTCLTVTLVNGIVLARSAFHHSMNYESVVLFGKAKPVDEEEKRFALQVISDQVLKKRWEEVRQPNEKELKATMVLKIKIDEASAKIRTGGPIDEKEDYLLNIWAGEIPLQRRFAPPVPDENNLSDLSLPDSVRALY